MKPLLLLALAGVLPPAVSGTSAAAASPMPFGATIVCTATATKTLVRTFVRDYDAGRVAAVGPLWAPEPAFQWFSTRAPGARLGASAYDRATLLAYFRARARVHENLRLTELRAGYDPTRNIVNFAGKLVRSADDLALGPPQDFKGASDCRDGRSQLIVWSM
jgi:hypothetical protein